MKLLSLFLQLLPLLALANTQDIVDAEEQNQGNLRKAPSVNRDLINLNQGDTVTSPFVVEMGVSGMTIKPAGEVQAGEEAVAEASASAKTPILRHYFRYCKTVLDFINAFSSKVFPSSTISLISGKSCNVNIFTSVSRNDACNSSHLSKL